MLQRWKKQVMGQVRRWQRFILLTVLTVIGIAVTPHASLVRAGSAVDLKPLPTPAVTPRPSAPTVTPPPTSAPAPSPTEPNPQATPAAPATSGSEPKEQRRQRPQPTTTRTPAAKPSDGTAAAGVDPRIAEADRLLLAGRREEAIALYRQVKTPFATNAAVAPIAAPILEPSQLPPAALVFLREADAGEQSKLFSAIKVPLQLLVEQYPQFIPGHLRLAAFLESQKDLQGAQSVIEKALVLYPNQPELVRAMINFNVRDQKWIEASLAARQFAILNPEHPRAAEFSALSGQYMQKFQAQLRGQIRESAITSAFTGLVGVAVTGSPLSSVNTVQSMVYLMRGETAVGNGAVRAIKQQAKRQPILVEDPMVTTYVNNLGQKLAKLAGRNEFQYEFYVLADDSLNAFALPGGKVFVSSGAMTRARSEAELAGLLGHEIAHAVLSHGFQSITQGTAIANITQLIPYVGQAATAATVNRYSREMEREADILGTRILAKSGYAADGLYNLTRTLEQQQRGSSVPPWLSSHPATPERVRYLQGLLQRHNYNRYTLEGVEQHQKIKNRITELMLEYFDKEDARNRRRSKA
jgi:Zn-dependent protease with chaperone function